MCIICSIPSSGWTDDVIDCRRSEKRSKASNYQSNSSKCLVRITSIVRISYTTSDILTPFSVNPVVSVFLPMTKNHLFTYLFANSDSVGYYSMPQVLPDATILPSLDTLTDQQRGLWNWMNSSYRCKLTLYRPDEEWQSE